MDARIKREVISLTVSAFSLLSLVGGCGGKHLEQFSQLVSVAPISDEYKLKKRLEGIAYVLPAEANTGQEQHKYNTVCDSLVSAFNEYGKDSCASFSRFKKKIPGKREPFNNLKVFSFSDFVNRISEKGLAEEYSQMTDFYEKSGMFRKSELNILGKKLGADYFVLPRLLEIKKWDSGRFSVGGMRIAQTQLASAMLGIEVWDTKTGYKVFSATSDTTIADEKISANPISVVEVFYKGWCRIFDQLNYGESQEKLIVRE